MTAFWLWFWGAWLLTLLAGLLLGYFAFHPDNKR